MNIFVFGFYNERQALPNSLHVCTLADDIWEVPELGCVVLTLIAFLSVSASWRKLSNSFMVLSDNTPRVS
jgi:hypothetical protein